MPTEDPVTHTRREVGWTPLDRLALLRVFGPQRVKFLHNLLSNDITGLATGQSRLAALMNLKGQQVAWIRVLAESDALICELPEAVRQTVLDTFIHYKVGAPVRFEKPEGRIFAVLGQKAHEALRDIGVESAPAELNSFVTVAAFGGTLRVSRGSDMPAGGYTIHADAASAPILEERLRASCGEPLAEDIVNTLRAEEGLPWHGIDVAEENLLHETGQLETYHSSSKGCYLGQEVVARLEGRGGNVNKRFRGLTSGHAMSAGGEITADGKVIGRVTTAGHSPEFGFIAMGYVHRSHAEPGTKVVVAGHGADVVALPFKA
ncbi:MAG: glycine cleavage T C-terminal barrel domain-containing protein [Vicinamibacteria bacterium]